MSDLSAEFGVVHLWCECRVNGQTLRVEQTIARYVYDDPEARKVIQEAIRQRLMTAILGRWKPKIQVRG